MINALISIIIPVYNVEKYLSRCIDSVLCQNQSRMEIILVDDGSTDSSSQICDEYQKMDSRIMVIHKENEGLGYARNSGIEKSNGDYIFFLDSDDFIPEGTLEYLLEVFTKTDVDIVSTSMIRTREEKIIKIEQPEECVKIVEGDQIILEYLRGNIATTAWAKMYKKSIFENDMFTNIELHEDAYSMHIFLGNSNRVAMTNRICYVQYIRDGSLMKSGFTEKRFYSIDVGKRLLEYIKSEYGEEKEYFVVLARLRLLSRQYYIIEDMLLANAQRKYHRKYSEIIKEMKENFETLNRNDFQQDELYEKIEKLLNHFLRYYLNLKFVKYKSKIIELFVRVKDKKDAYR